MFYLPIFFFASANHFDNVSNKTIHLYIIKTHGSDSRGQEEAACTRVFWPTQPLQ